MNSRGNYNDPHCLRSQTPDVWSVTQTIVTPMMQLMSPPLLRCHDHKWRVIRAQTFCEFAASNSSLTVRTYSSEYLRHTSEYLLYSWRQFNSIAVPVPVHCTLNNTWSDSGYTDSGLFLCCNSWFVLSLVTILSCQVCREEKEEGGDAMFDGFLSPVIRPLGSTWTPDTPLTANAASTGLSPTVAANRRCEY